jgi:hypothetical protein
MRGSGVWQEPAPARRVGLSQVAVQAPARARRSVELWALWEELCTD